MTRVSQKAHNQFYIARAEALNAYALVEKGLALLFATALETDPRYATLIISKIVNTRARNEVIQRVVDMRTMNAFRPFTNSLFSIIGQMDGERNKLVHWHVENKNGQIQLKPTDLLSESGDRMTEDQINALWGKALFVANVIHKFDDQIPFWAGGPPSRDRFLQPLRYPPEPDDPLAQMYRDIEAQPRPSEE